MEPLALLYGPAGPHGHLIVAAFPEGGRITVDAARYVAEGDRFVPVAETDFARDPTFGYTQSCLPNWVEEKTGGRWRASDVLRIPLSLLRGGDPEPVAALLCAARHNLPIVADCAAYADLSVLVAAALHAMARGHRLLYRTAASFVRARAGLSRRELVTRDDPGLAASGGALVLVGSHVTRMAEQVARAIRLPHIAARTLDGPTPGLWDTRGAPASGDRLGERNGRCRMYGDRLYQPEPSVHLPSA